MFLNIKEEDYLGPMAYNNKLAEYINKNGKLASEELPLIQDIKNPIWCKDINILHVPSNKVNLYSCYCDFETKKITIFNGFFQKEIEDPLENIKWVYSSEKTMIGRYSDEKQF